MANHWLQNYGFLPKLQKSSLQPIQGLECLGVILDTTCNCLILTKTKAKKMKEIPRVAINSRPLSLMTLMKLMGLLISSTDTLQWGHFHMRSLQQLLRPFQLQIMNKKDPSIRITLKVKTSLARWTRTFTRKVSKLDKIFYK